MFYWYLRFVCVYMLFLNTSGECNNLWESQNNEHRGAKYHLVGTSVDMINCGRLEIVRNQTTNFDMIKTFEIFTHRITFECESVGSWRPHRYPLSAQSFGTCSCTVAAVTVATSIALLAVAQLTRLSRGMHILLWTIACYKKSIMTAIRHSARHVR